MARIVQRRMFWEAPAATDVELYGVYVGDPALGVDFLNGIDSGMVEPHASVPAPTTEYYLASLPEGDYQLAVAAKDDDGNWSDPYQHPAWVNVPLDITPPAAPTGGGLE